jgi:two-component system response regulator FlrC
MSINANLPSLLWLDPLEPLGEHELALLSDLGLRVERIQTLDELQSSMGRTPPVQALVIRHDPAFNLQHSVQALFKELGETLPIICRVDRLQMNWAVSAMREGAAYALATEDFSVESWQSALDAAHAQIKGQVVQAMTRVVTKQRSRGLKASPIGSVQRQLVYVDPISQHLLALAQRVAQADVTALIEGPTGAGKEILARVLHESSKRAHGPFVGLNCAALPEQLIDDMLFGHEKGAFTGAQKDLRGLFEQAHGGTLFLDEIGEMPMHLQAKLLRVLQERQITRLGSEQLVHVDVRVIAATNKDLRAAIATREFREDLYFRISTFKLNVPPLRQRPGDILPLVAALLQRHAGEGRQFTVSAQAQTQLLSYGWPGNVRELENVVQRAVVLCPGNCIEPQHLMFDESADPTEGATFEPMGVPVLPASNAQPIESSVLSPPIFEGEVTHHPFSDLADQIRALPAANLQAAVKSNELQLILAAIQSSDSRIEAARKLGISPRTLRYKLAKIKAKTHEPASSALSSAPMALAVGG